jgi:D-arabinose 1-dehydrogenase-like Zn-dependent alcohol dehydrogenase
VPEHPTRSSSLVGAPSPDGTWATADISARAGMSASSSRQREPSGAGGGGHLALQIAKVLGAHVIGTASAGKHEFVRSLGADEVIDYRTTDFADQARDIDVVFETVGGDYAVRSRRTPAR